MSNYLLIVEDEGTLLSNWTRGLQSLGDSQVRVVACMSVEEALSEIAHRLPDAAVLDLNLPGLSGIDLAEDLAQRGVPLIITTAYAASFRDRIEVIPKLALLEKPVRLSSLRVAVAEALGQDAPQEKPFRLTDYVQMGALSRRDVRFVVGLRSRQEGTIDLVQGAPWAAAVGDLRGLAALENMLVEDPKDVAFAPLQRLTEVSEIDESLESILLRLATAADERQRGRYDDTPPTEDPSTEATAAAPPEDYESLYRGAVAAYLERRTEEAQRLLERCLAIRPNDLRVQQNLERLKGRM